MMRLGLTGYPLKHTFSPEYFRKKFDVAGIQGSYGVFELPSISRNILNDLIRREALNGFNVTLPYKISMCTMIDELDDIAQQTESVNTVVVSELQQKIKLTGYNTDAGGFKKMLQPLLRAHHYRALILGNGGSSRSVKYVLQHMGIECMIATRNPVEPFHIFYTAINKHVLQAHPLVINTTPCGMWPSVNTMPPFPVQYLGENHLLADLVYNPEKTLLMERAEQYGASTVNGLGMLYHQADLAFEIWQKHQQLQA